MTTYAPITEKAKLSRNCLLCPQLQALPPKDGFHLNIPEAQYHRIAAASQSMLKLDTPMDMRAYMNGDLGFDDTDATTFGTNLHARLLEPERFAKECIDGPINPKTEKPYGAETKAYADFMADNPGKLVLGKGDRTAIEAAASNMLSHDPIGVGLRRNIGQREVTLIWTCPNTGIPCKGRVDLLSDDILIDLKTARSIKDRAIQSAILDRAYDMQGAHYLWGCKILGAPREMFGFGWIQNTVPYKVRGTFLDDKTLEIGRDKVLTGMSRLARALGHNEWVGYPNGMEVLGLPKFEIDKYANEGID